MNMESKDEKHEPFARNELERKRQMIASHALRKYKRESAGCLILDFLYEHETGPIFTERRRLQGESD